MVDMYQTLAERPDDFVAEVARGLENRAQDPAQQHILESYLADIDFPDGAVVVEIGCGTGVVCRRLAELDAVTVVTGIDPAPGLIERARQYADKQAKTAAAASLTSSLAPNLARMDFHIARGEDTGLQNEHFDVVVLHTILSHVPDQAAILAEARRLLKPGGWLAVCDADFSKTSVAICAGDPLQACVMAWVEGNVTDQWLVPRLPGLLRAAGFEMRQFRGYNRADLTGRSSAPNWVERGAAALVREGKISTELGAALFAEVKRRVDTGQFYGALPFASAVATKI